MFQSVDCVLLDIEGRFPTYDLYIRRDVSVRKKSDARVFDNRMESHRSAASDRTSCCGCKLLRLRLVREQQSIARRRDFENCKALDKLMAMDSKSTGLKMLQGLVWKNGFESGALRAELFDDVLPAMKRWKDSGIDLRIYSSGSVLAQKLFFRPFDSRGRV